MMKRTVWLFLLFWTSFATAQTLSLDGEWYFARTGSGKWLPASVPGTVHQDLIRNGLLPDPFYGVNESRIQWVEEEDWEYRKVFVLTEEDLGHDSAVLSFGGLDTYADVFLNGALVLRADNMFTGYEVAVGKLLRKGENRLHIRFHSPVKHCLPQWASNGFDYPADNDHRKEKLSVFSRKAPYSYGWDWGIRMVTSGIWRPVSLRFHDGVAVKDLYVRQLELTDSKASLSCGLEMDVLSGKGQRLRVLLSYGLPGGKRTETVRDTAVVAGNCRMDIPFCIQDPERWMPNGWGRPVLYEAEVAVVAGKDTLARERKRFGLRTLRVVKEKDEAGECFHFEVNGMPLFAKGANYIPSDAMLPAVTEERYRRLFRDIREANMNMVRVWGGGVYEDDLFYDLADENGILVWQDFMFACTPYPHDPAFLERVQAEAGYNVKRLRQHPCLAMWCGNNEILEGLKYWGWNRKYAPEVYAGMQEGYDSLFYGLLPRVVENLDPGRFYMHGSPFSANWGRPESWKTGDSHNWGVWYGRKPFESLEREIPRFMSEFGFQAFPEMKTIATFAAPEDYALDSEVMVAHQKSSIGNDLIRTYMERDYRVPEKFEDFVYVGLVMQGRGMRLGMEAHRRNRPYCMGSLYWQLNDSWPVVSWSGIDYYGNWKALHYQARRAFAPLAASVRQQGDSLEVWLLSDLPARSEGLELRLELRDFRGRLLRKEGIRTSVAANSSALVWQGSVSDWTQGQDRKSVFLLVTLKDGRGRCTDGEPWYFVAPKDLALEKPQIRTRMTVEEGCCKLWLRSDVLVRDVFVEVPYQGARFSDNFFDLLPGRERTVTITSPEFRKGDRPQWKLHHLRETYE